VYCSICKSASDSKLAFPSSTRSEQDSYKAFVVNGFSWWHKAIERFKKHEKGNVHRAAVLSQLTVKKGVNIAASLLKGKLQKIKTAWQAVLRIISSVQFLAQQGLAVCGY
jgi:hypothetical protein